MLQEMELGKGLAGQRMGDLLAGRGQGPVLADVVGIVFVLAVDDPDNDHPTVGIDEIATLGQGFDGVGLGFFHGDQGDLFHPGVVAGFGMGIERGDGPVGLPQDPHEEFFTHAKQPSGKQCRRSAAFGHDGKPVEFHEELVDEAAIAFVAQVVAHGEFLDVEAESFEFHVQIGRKRAVDSRQIEVALVVQGHDMGPVHLEDGGEQGGVVFQARHVGFGEIVAELILDGLGQSGAEGSGVLTEDGGFQRALFAGRLVGIVEQAVQDVVLEDFLEIFERPHHGDHGETGQILVLEQIRFKGGQQLAEIEHRIVRLFAKGAQQTFADMHPVQEAFEVVQGLDAQDLPFLGAKAAMKEGGFGGARKGVGPVEAHGRLISRRSAFEVVVWSSEKNITV